MTRKKMQPLPSKSGVVPAKPKKKRAVNSRRVNLKEQREELERVKTDLYAMMRNGMVGNAMNPILTRTGLSSFMGTQFGGERDLYGTFGYPITLTYNHYRAMYDRMGMATRLVEKFSDDTWGKPPTLVDGDARSDGVGDKTSPFLDDWNAIVKKLQLYQIMRQADIMCGIGRYSIIFLGTAGAFEAPARANGGLFYLSAFDESQAKIKSYIRDTRSERFAMPERYEVQFSSLDEWENARERLVHHTRCIHISENRLGSRVFGRPRMQEVFNRLMDLEKVTGGGAEAAWLAVYMGFLLLTREGTELPDENTEEWQATEAAIERFAHRMQRFATLKGVDQVHNLGVHEVRVKDIWSVIMGDLAGSKGIPQRILLGSERGELASSQDMQEWNGVIRSRQLNFAEPEIMDPFINSCIQLGVMRPPKSGKWTTEWQPVYTPTQIEEAEYALKVAQGANQVTNGAPELALLINEWRGMLHLPPLDLEEVIKAIQELEEIGIDEGDEESVLQGEKAAEGREGKGNGQAKGVKVPSKAYPRRAGTPNRSAPPEENR